MPPPYPLLSRLWLHEPDPALIARAAADLDLPPAAPAALAAGYTDLLLLNVYPYSSVFTEPDAELNGPAAELAASRYAAHGYQPAALFGVGAPDHLGLMLGFLDHLDQGGLPAARAAALAEALAWVPAVCLAVQLEPGVLPFYHALAARTAATLLAEADGLRLPPASLPPAEPGPLPDPEGEVRLRDLVRFFLSPARCGAFLSRGCLGRVARDLGLALPFGSRVDVAEGLFQAAGANAQVPVLLADLDAILATWAAGYTAWAAAHPAWSLCADAWLARLAVARGQLSLMRAALS